jgi:hypothetical protein
MSADELVGKLPWSRPEVVAGIPAWRENGALIVLRHPYLFPTAWHPPVVSPKVTEVFVQLDPGARTITTDLSLGHERASDHVIIFETLSLPGDPFKLRHGECQDVTQATRSPS